MDKGQGDEYERQLAWFKANEMPESALLVEQSLLRFLVAWKRVEVKRKKRLATPAKRGKAGIWRWLWQNVDFSMEEFAALSGASVPDAAAKFRMLSGNGMVYPDGTLNAYVDKLLKARIILLFQKSKPRGPQKEEQRPKSVERR